MGTFESRRATRKVFNGEDAREREGEVAVIRSWSERLELDSSRGWWRERVE